MSDETPAKVTVVKPRGRRLRSQANVRALVAAEIRRVENDPNIPSAKKASLLFYGAQQLSHAIEKEAAETGQWAKVQEIQKTVLSVRADLDAFKTSPEFAAFMARRTERKDEDDCEVDPDVAQRQQQLAETEKGRRLEEQEQAFLEQNAPGFARQLKMGSE